MARSLKGASFVSFGRPQRSDRDGRHVATVGLLMRQAAGVYFLALHKLLAWSEAAPAGAMLPSKRAGEMQLLQLKGASWRAQAEASPSGTGGKEGGGGGGLWPEMESLPTLKSVTRVQQKLMRAYAADASRSFLLHTAQSVAGGGCVGRCSSRRQRSAQSVGAAG